MAICRDSKGRFCRRPDIETPDLPLSYPLQIGDIGYRACSPGLGNDRPVRGTVKAHIVTEIQEGNPICFPYSWRPDLHVDLTTFDRARKDAVKETIEARKNFFQAAFDACEDVSTRYTYDFRRPKNMTHPLYNIGDWVYVVNCRRKYGLCVDAYKGTITGLYFDNDPDPDEESGWKYHVYYQRLANAIDIEHETGKPGEIVEDGEWVYGSSLYMCETDAIEAINSFIHEVADKYAAHLKQLRHLKPEDVPLEQDTE